MRFDGNHLQPGLIRVLSWAAVLACVALVLWIRLMPLWLSGADDLADRIARERIREFLAQEVSQELSPAQRQRMIADQAKQWIEKNPDAFESVTAENSWGLESQLRYQGKDGGEYAYLGDLDSYLWLRQARNYLRTGTICDAVVDGTCRDTYTNAPVGTRMAYERSLHVAAIVGLHSFITLFDPDYPLPASSFLVPVIIGALGVLPAFFIGLRLVGAIGGMFAAVLVALQPEFLVRSIGSDNDVWNLVLPLFAIWAAMAAIDARDTWRQIAYGVLAGAVVGLHALVWGGWLFTYAVLIGGLLGYLLLQGLGYAIGEQTLRVWRAARVRKAALVSAVFYGAAGLCTTLAGSEEPYFRIPIKIFAWVTGWTSGGIPGGSPGGNPGDLAESEYWPDLLTTVSELLEPDTGMIIAAMGGELFFFGGLLGLLLLLLPKRHWNWRHLAVLFGGISCYGYLISAGELDRVTTLWLVATPLAGALLLQLFEDLGADEADRGAALILAVWFLAALHMAHAGNRFLMLLGPPFGIVCAVAVGRLSAWVRGVAQETFTRFPVVANTLFGLVLALLLLQPVRWGYASARGYVPKMNDAWWDTLTNIRDQSHADAIVNTWWDYGHWVKYVADRRVSSDGSSQRSHVPHWLGKALIAARERESVGLLRMLNCGSDATPRPEGKRGAYGKLRALGRDPVAAHAIVKDLVKLDKAAARSYLEKHGLSAPQRTRVLRSTHCVPPESYLVLSSRLFELPALMHLGRWDPRRAHIAKRTRFLGRQKAVADLMERFGYTEQQAARLHEQARAQAGKRARAGARTLESQLDNFIGPSEGLLAADWLGCQVVQDQNALSCNIGMRIGLVGVVPGVILERFVYYPAAPVRSRFEMSHSERNSVGEVAPAVIVVAGLQRKEEMTLAAPTIGNLGVLMDTANGRILLGPPALVRSTITHLMFLDGRYTAHYEKFDERTTYDGERVATWKINWDGF